MDNICMKGAYKGVPYTIYYDESAPWDIVDPRNRITDVVFMAYGKHGHINYGDEQENLCEDALHDIVSQKMDTIIKNYQKENGGGKLTEDAYADREEEITSELSEALRASDMEEIKRILDMAEVEYRAKQLTGNSQSDFCESLYFFEGGRKFSEADQKEYEMELADINCWVWGSCYTAEVGLESCSGFLAEDYPDLDDDNGLSYYIKEEVDNLLSKKKANYTITADYATVESKNGNDNIKYDNKKQLKIHVDSEEEAKAITGIFEGNALLSENSNSRQQ